MSRTWGRLYAGTRNHRKIRILRQRHPTMWFAWYVLIELAVECDDDGWIYVAPDRPYTWKELAQEIGTGRADTTERFVRTLVELGLASYTEGKGLRLNSYSDRNYESDISTLRVQKYRERKKLEGANETFQQRSGNVSVTDQNRNRTETEQNIYIYAISAPQVTEESATQESGTHAPSPAPPSSHTTAKKSRNKNGNGYSPEFEEFWKTKIHRPEDRKMDAWKRWQKLLKENALPPLDQLLKLTRRYNAAHEDADRQYLPQTFRWLENRLFEQMRDPPVLMPDPECQLCHGHGFYLVDAANGRKAGKTCSCLHEVEQ